MKKSLIKAYPNKYHRLQLKKRRSNAKEEHYHQQLTVVIGHNKQTTNKPKDTQKPLAPLPTATQQKPICTSAIINPSDTKTNHQLSDSEMEEDSTDTLQEK